MQGETVAVTASDDVSLEAEWSVPGAPHAAVVLSHPHPRHGGDMHSGIIGWLFEALPAREVATLRLNFRGVGRSGGRHSDGVGERLDLAAALGTVRSARPELPVVLVGWSFGADVALAVDGPGVAAWVALAPNFRAVPADQMAAGRDDRPALLMVPEHDQVCPPELARAEVARWAGRGLEVRVLAGADHFLGGAAAAITDAVLAVTRDVAG